MPNGTYWWGERGGHTTPTRLPCYIQKYRQCETTTKVALFQGTDEELFRDRKEFKGSILKQLEDVYQFIDLVNKTKATFSGLDRTDRRDYPEEVVREALLNSIFSWCFTIEKSEPCGCFLQYEID